MSLVWGLEIVLMDNEFKTIKDDKRRSGAGSVNWEFFPLMDGRLALTLIPLSLKDSTLTTRPFERRPLCPADPLLNGGSPPSSQFLPVAGCVVRCLCWCC